MPLARTASSPLAVVSAREYLFDHQRDRQACVLFIEAHLTISVTFDRYKSLPVGWLIGSSLVDCGVIIIGVVIMGWLLVVMVLLGGAGPSRMPAPDPAGCQCHVPTRVTVGVFLGVALR